MTDLIDQFFTKAPVPGRVAEIAPTPLVRYDRPGLRLQPMMAKQWVRCASCGRKVDWGWSLGIPTVVMRVAIVTVADVAECCGAPECVAGLPEANQRATDWAQRSECWQVY